GHRVRRAGQKPRPRPGTDPRAGGDRSPVAARRPAARPGARGGGLVTLLTALARIEAPAVGRALPIRTVRHSHLGRRPLVVTPLELAGDAGGPPPGRAGCR